ncbi:MAG: DUF192 domain-containing protein [Sphingomicrobium sp.]
MRAGVAALAIAAGLALAACQPSASIAASPVAESGLAQRSLTVTGPYGKHRFIVEVAATPAEQQRGLMFRRSLGPDRGMIFPFAAPEQATFWMKDTLIPLDLIFIRADGSIANIAANARPMDETLLPSEGMVDAVLELAGGRAAELGIRPGDRVEWRR